GPSGCGKTTTLRIVAGFVRHDAGDVLVKGRDVRRVPPHQRDIGLVFQSYALFPHLTVAENVAFGLRMRRVPRAEIAKRVAQVLELVQLPGLADRLPKQLSGGQQQRVALARAIVIEPQLLLLDEPFSNLDQRLRQELRQEVRSLQRRLGITSVFVTHDQEEALQMADRIAVMHQGRLQQIGRPADLYERPASVFIARFLGDCNLFYGALEGTENGQGRVRTKGGALLSGTVESEALAVGARVAIAVRPERLRLLPGDTAPSRASGNTAGNRLAGRVETMVYRGGQRRYVVRLDGDAKTPCEIDVPNVSGATDFSAGASVALEWATDDGRVLRSE
ncbi:MAG: ABC transporter ATP-binding protein, partial [Chloroflexi bacterium]|nr:ABC transporter ATP-binding protein [Chloroflexota bacterium]